MTVNAGANEEGENSSTNYGRVGIAVSQMLLDNITILNPDINEAQFRFEPDVEHNAIVYALKAINGIGDDVVQNIISNRPYKSIDDFAERMLDTNIIKNSQMIMLIKAGCFLKLHSSNRAETMEWYLRKYKFKEIEKLTLSQLKSIEEYNIIPEELQICLRYIKYKDYVLDNEGWIENYINPDKKVPKCGYHDRYYILDEPSQIFFQEHFTEDSVIRINGTNYVISEKTFTKEVNEKIQPLRDWFASSEAINAYNKAQYKALWKQYADGNEPHWSMQALTYYDQEHELSNVNDEIYGIVDFNMLPVEPEPYDHYFRYVNGEQKTIDKYKIQRLAGAVIANDNNRHTISLLTKYGNVTCKFPREQYSHYNRRLSKVNPDGSKTVVENSWFARGNLLAVVGIRQDDNFRVMNYADTVYKHSCERILEVHPDGTLLLQAERAKV